MIVHVTCYTEMRRYAPDGRQRFDREVPAGSRIKDLLATLGVPPALRPVATVNGNRADVDTLLSPGDRIVLFTPSEGG